MNIRIRAKVKSALELLGFTVWGEAPNLEVTLDWPNKQIPALKEDWDLIKRIASRFFLVSAPTFSAGGVYVVYLTRKK